MLQELRLPTYRDFPDMCQTLIEKEKHHEGWSIMVTTDKVTFSYNDGYKVEVHKNMECFVHVSICSLLWHHSIGDFIYLWCVPCQQSEQRSASFPFDVAQHGLKTLLRVILERAPCKGMDNVSSVVKPEEMGKYAVANGTYWSIHCQVNYYRNSNVAWFET